MRKFALAVATLFSVSSFAGMNVKVHQPFPQFTLKKLGAPVKGSLSQYRGKVVIVDFWASWCEPCKKEVPALNNLYKKWARRGVVVLGVNVDDDESTAKDFVKDNPVSFPLFHDDNKRLANQCALSTMPSSFVVDRKGIVRYIHSGYQDGDVARFEKEIKSVL